MVAFEKNTQAFTDEATELLAELEEALLELEDRPDDTDLIDRVFRAMHTIKGSGAMFGFDDIATFTHDVENVFDLVRAGEIPVTTELLNMTLAARDHIAYLLECFISRTAVDVHSGAALTRQVQSFLPASSASGKAVPGQREADEYQEETPCTYRIRFRPYPGFFSYGSNPLGILEELGEIGACDIFLHLEDLPDIEDMEPEACHVWWDVLLTTSRSRMDIQDVFLFVEDDCELLIQMVDDAEKLDTDAGHKRLGEILVERGDISIQDLQEVLARKRPLIQPLGAALAESGKVSQASVESALEEQMAVRSRRQDRSGTGTAVQEGSGSIRVAAGKLDHLVDLVGELVIVQAQISEYADNQGDSKLISLSEDLDFLSESLRDSTLDIRMLPIGSTFSRFKRLVRDLSADLGKSIELKTSGAETELDKTVIERLADPLVHLLRNCIDHGIETPSERSALGKEATGTISLSAKHAAGEVNISIADDGRGLDRDVLLKKATAKGLISPDAILDDEEVYRLIFLPGFSTAEKVSNVSGRGVGMDVVKSSIDSLRGTVDLTSEPGRGTTVTIRLPLTLAIIDGLQVVVGDEYFVIPLSSVEECVELGIESRDGDGRRKLLNLRDEVVPYIRLREWFNTPGNRPDIEQVVITSTHMGRFGVVVDSVIGEHQTVIKSLGRIYRDLQWISGATIKGDGSMALILDVAQLMHCHSMAGS